MAPWGRGGYCSEMLAKIRSLLIGIHYCRKLWIHHWIIDGIWKTSSVHKYSRFKSIHRSRWYNENFTVHRVPFYNEKTKKWTPSLPNNKEDLWKFLHRFPSSPNKPSNHKPSHRYKLLFFYKKTAHKCECTMENADNGQSFVKLHWTYTLLT